ncbi:unnamed protein product [Nesidiocoris tenuis]|uniref:Uncharacterized protein n=1 Tax=Nesidiocoris tenuis TaxID=355587 RepID=A0A6H5GYJ1_9HEMI|nr:unnamed protein product [Nesidiocoris tenuis]
MTRIARQYRFPQFDGQQSQLNRSVRQIPREKFIPALCFTSDFLEIAKVSRAEPFSSMATGEQSDFPKKRQFRSSDDHRFPCQVARYPHEYEEVRWICGSLQFLPSGDEIGGCRREEMGIGDEKSTDNGNDSSPFDQRQVPRLNLSQSPLKNRFSLSDLTRTKKR